MDIREAFEEYKNLGVGTQQWPEWAALFTADAKYWERGYDYHFTAGADIGEWIVPEMEQYKFLTLWMDWAIFDGDKVCLYIWNNLPVPEGVTNRTFGFPNSTFLQFDAEAAAAGAVGKWSAEWDHYSGLDAAEVFGRWMKVGGHPKGAVADWSLTGTPGWQPAVSTEEHSRDEVESALQQWTAAAMSSWKGDPTAWLSMFSPDALIRDHGLGASKGLRTPHEFWNEVGSRPGIGPSSEFEVAMPWWVLEGNRAGVLFEITGEHGSTDGCAILHYAGNGMFDFEESVYNPMGVTAVTQG